MIPIPTIVQQPVTSRYTALWYRWFVEHRAFDVLGTPDEIELDRSLRGNWFADVIGSMRYEERQIEVLMCMDNVRRVLILDFDFPGLAIAMLPLIRLRHPFLEAYALAHAGSWCNGDIFEGDRLKAEQEKAGLAACKKVFVASEYHARLIRDFAGIAPIVLDGLPLDLLTLHAHRKTRGQEKDVVVLGRPEQSDRTLEEMLSGYDRPPQMPRDEYLNYIANYKVAVIVKTEETFGYSALEAAALGLIPLVPASFAYRESIPRRFWYHDREELQRKLVEALVSPEAYHRARSGIDFTAYDPIVILDRLVEEIEDGQG